MVAIPSILITDDDRGFRETLREVFAPRGFRTILAGDGEVAVEIIRQDSVHVLLVDMHMPRLTGLETLRLVKQEKSLLPCILISAAMDSDLAREALAADAFSVLAKPVRLPEVTDVVNRALAATYNWPIER